MIYFLPKEGKEKRREETKDISSVFLFYFSVLCESV